MALQKTRATRIGRISEMELQVRAEELGVQPFDILLLFAKGDSEALGYDPDPETGLPPAIPPKYRLAAAQEACKYLYPQLKSVEVTGDAEKPVEQKHTLVTDYLEVMEAAVRAGKNDPVNDDAD